MGEYYIYGDVKQAYRDIMTVTAGAVAASGTVIAASSLMTSAIQGAQLSAAAKEIISHLPREGLSQGTGHFISHNALLAGPGAKAVAGSGAKATILHSLTGGMGGSVLFGLLIQFLVAFLATLAFIYIGCALWRLLKACFGPPFPQGAAGAAA